MGLFANYLLDGNQWIEEPGSEVVPTAPWLRIHIHDSDLTELSYAPVGRGEGVAYLGFTPRSYVGDDDAPATDPDREAAGLADWWALRNRAVPADVRPKEIELRRFLAQDEEPTAEVEDDETVEDPAEPDDADIFVELKTAKFLKALGLSIPEGLPSL
ncbi:hypothetical protein GCM10027589_05470 [Actinocorallia lasiicapitis]